MKFSEKHLLLYAVTDRAWTGEYTLYQQVEQALLGGATMIQLREKNMAEEDFLKEALEIRELTRTYQVPLIINDNIEIALRADADGVHVGQSDLEASEARKRLGKDKILGVTAKTPEQAEKAEAAGADYLGSGAVFGSETKKDTSYLPLEQFQKVCQSTRLPVVAIGGIHKGNIEKLKGSGAKGAAVVSGIFGSEDIKKETKILKSLAEQVFLR